MILRNLYTFEKWGLVNGIWRKLGVTRALNIVPTQGLNEIQKEFWTGAAYTASIFVGIIRTDNFGAVALTDVAAKIVTGIPGGGDNQWREFTGYSEGVRQTLSMGSAVSGALDNSASPAIFSVTSAFTLQGGFLVTSSVKGGVAGLLIGATSAPSTQAFLVGQQVRLIISSTLSN